MPNSEWPELSEGILRQLLVGLEDKIARCPDCDAQSKVPNLVRCTHPFHDPPSFKGISVTS